MRNLIAFIILFALAAAPVAASAQPLSINPKSVDQIMFVNGSIVIRGNPDSNCRAVLNDTTLPGMTHIECYFNWGELEPQEDHWLTDGFDDTIKVAASHGIKIELLPCFVPPAWFKQTPDYAPLINMTTGQILPGAEEWMPNLSPWAPGTFKGHEHLYAFLAAHYKGQIDIVKFYTEVGLWVNQAGFWCGDPYARADFRERMLNKYGTLAALNTVWGSNFNSPDQIVYPDQDRRFQEPRRWVDFLTWFADSQVRAQVKELALIRKYFPTTSISIPLGYGSDNASGGSDRTAIVRAAAPFAPVSIRSTHGSFNRDHDPKAYWFYKRMAPLCHDLNIGFGTEPPGGDLSYGEVRRQEFEDASAGANFIFQYYQNFHKTATDGATPHIIDDYRQILRPYERPLVDIGVLYPTTQMQLDMSDFPKDQLAFCGAGREYFDYDLVDENLIDWGYLNRYSVLLQTSGQVYRGQTLAAMAKWIHSGGILVCDGTPDWSSLEGCDHITQPWLKSELAPISDARVFAFGKGRIYVADVAGEPEYLAKVVSILSSIAAARPAAHPLNGFKADSDGHWMTQFPDSRLVYNPATYDWAFIPVR